MSILIQGMEMPNVCAYCFIDPSECNLHSSVNIWRERHPDCPLIELPPHGRLIDADVLKQSAHLNGQLKTYIDTWIDSHATVIEAEGETDA